MTRSTNNLIGQTGEYLIASELCRRGFIATTFTRNMPDFDILAAKNQTMIKIQVKTKQAGDWQLTATSYLNIELDGDAQIIKGVKELDDSNIIFIFVKLFKLGKDEIYIINIKDLQHLIYQEYSTFLDKHNGRRPRNPRTFHTKISTSHLQNFRDNWQVIDNDICYP